MRQPKLPIPGLPLARRDHGGDLRKGRRKEARPLDPGSPIHLVMRSSVAKGSWSMLDKRNRQRIEHEVRANADRYGIVIQNYVNVGNHLHLVVRTKSRRYWAARTAFQGFLRRTAGAIAMLITGAAKGRAMRFWDKTAYTRVVTWRRELKSLSSYLMENFFESVGLPRKDRIRSWEQAGLRDIWNSLETAGFAPP